MRNYLFIAFTVLMACVFACNQEHMQDKLAKEVETQRKAAQGQFEDNAKALLAKYQCSDSKADRREKKDNIGIYAWTDCDLNGSVDRIHRQVTNTKFLEYKDYDWVMVDSEEDAEILNIYRELIDDHKCPDGTVQKGELVQTKNVKNGDEVYVCGKKIDPTVRYKYRGSQEGKSYQEDFQKLKPNARIHQ